MSALLLLALTAAPPFPPSGSHAFLVTVDRYPALPAESRLQAAANDLATMQALCAAYRVPDVKTLTQSQATLAAISAELDALVSRVKPGDDVLFYFGGRGGRALSPDGTLTATLAPYDAHADSGRGDLSMLRIAKWATAIKAAGGKPVIVVDACWQRVPTRSEARPYNPTPRYFERASSGDLAQVYTGPGTFAAPCDARGQAFEWKQGPTAYAGAFTDLLSSSAALASLRRERPTLGELVGNVAREANALTSQGYMPGFRPRLEGEGRELPLLGGEFQLPSAGPMADLVKREREAADLFRVAVDVESAIDDPIQANAVYRQAHRELTEFARTLDGVRIVGRDDFRPDRVVVVGRDGEQVTLRVLDEDQRQITLDTPLRKAASFAEILTGGLGEILQRDAYVTRLFRFAESKPPTADFPWKMDFKSKYEIGDFFSATVSSEKPGTAYIFDRADAVGLVRLMFPYWRQTGTRVGPGNDLTIPSHQRWQFREKSPLGTSVFRVILIDTQPEVIEAEDAPAFSKSLTSHLKSVLAGIQTGQIRWSAKTVIYEVLPKS